MPTLHGWLLTLIFPVMAYGQADAGKTANPGGTEGAAELQRSSGLPDAQPAAAATPTDSAAAQTAAPTDPSRPGVKEEAVQGPAPVTPVKPTNSVLVEDDGVTGHIGGQLRFSAQGATSFPADNAGTTFQPAPLETRIRVIPEVHYRGFGFLAEADTATGAVTGNPDSALTGDLTPHPAFDPLEMRQIYLEYKWRTGLFRVGQQTSQWGLGMVANAGAKDPEAGDFGQTHFGDSAYRALLAGRPFFNLGGAWRAVEPALAVDLVVRDGTATFTDGDRAFQGVFALRFAADTEKYLGFYAVYRHQTAVGVTDGGRAADVVVLDIAGKWHFLHSDWRDLFIGFEGAAITGTTTLGRTDTAPSYDVKQFGAAVKASYRYGNGQVYLDFGYASGDQNPNDAKQEAFKFNRDYPVGLILFNEVLGWQSSRAAARAMDPKLLGVAPEGANLIPTQGAFTGAVYVFPKVRYGVREWIDVYGGPMFAWTSAALTDPFNTKLGGGTAVNYLGAHPGSYLGTELDVGLQVRFHPVPELTLSGTLEGGVLFPGDAFSLGVGGVMGPVGLGRIRLSANL